MTDKCHIFRRFRGVSAIQADLIARIPCRFPKIRERLCELVLGVTDNTAINIKGPIGAFCIYRSGSAGWF